MVILLTLAAALSVPINYLILTNASNQEVTLIRRVKNNLLTLKLQVVGPLNAGEILKFYKSISKLLQFFIKTYY